MKQLTQEDFVRKAIGVHGNRYNYSDSVYKNLNTKLKIYCPVHGVFEQTPRNHITMKSNCPMCSDLDRITAAANRRGSTAEFKIKAHAVHGDYYDYSKSKYVTSRIKVIIGCPVHGDFTQSPDNHVNNHQGCPECGRMRKGGIGQYTEELLKSNLELANTSAYFYVVEFSSDIEHFYKLGITTRNVTERLGKHVHNGMEINTIIEKQTTLLEAFFIEQSLLQQLKEFKYFPNTYFGGITECVKYSDSVIQTIRAQI